jgi:hypothetical protein
MKLSISELIAKVTGLEARATQEFQTELAELRGLVEGELTSARADLSTAQASIKQLGTELESAKAQGGDEKKRLETIVAGLDAVCLNLGVVSLKDAAGQPLAADASDADKSTALAAIPDEQKFEALKTGFQTALQRITGVPIKSIPASQVAAVSGDAKTMTRAQFNNLTPKAQAAFFRTGGRLTA